MENNKPQKKLLPPYLMLALIALIAAVVLAATNMVTEGPIQERQMAQLMEAFGSIMPDADAYEEMTVPGDYNVNSLYAAKKNGEVIGYCVTASKSGYQSPVAVTMGVGTDGVVTSAVIGDSNFAETEGLGSRTRSDEYQAQFSGLVVAEGGAIECLTGATITSTAVLDASNAALKCVNEVALGNAPAEGDLLVFGVAEKKPAAAPAVTGNSATSKGFQSDVTVTATFDANGAVETIEIISDGETPGFGTRCGEDEAFLNQFIGKTAPFTAGENVDVLTGATYTSNAVIEAVNQALASVPAEGEVPATVIAEGENATLSVNANGEAIVTPANGYTGDVNVSLTVENGAVATGEFVAPAEEVPAVEGEEKTASAKGFQSDVTVTVTVDAEGKIAAIKVDSASETPGFGTRCAEDEAYLAQFIGKTIPVEDADVLTGATFTSNAVVTAINSLAAAEEETVEEEAVVEGEEKTASAKGFQSDVTVTVTIDAEGKIAAIKVDSASETPGFGTRCAEDEAYLAQFIGKTIPVEDADVLTGATYTSNAVVAAINSLAAAEEEVASTGKSLSGTIGKPATEEETASTGNSFSGTIGKPATEEETASTGNSFSGTIGKPATEEETASTGNSFSGTIGKPAAESAPAAEGEEKTASAKGFASDVTVTVTVDAEGTITAIKVDSASETPGFGTRCAEDEAYLAQFIGKTIPVEDADVLTGATYTSNAVVAAINSLAQ